MLKGSTWIDDLDSSFRMRRLWRLWRHDVVVTWRHRYRHKSTCRKHFLIGSLLDMNPWMV